MSTIQEDFRAVLFRQASGMAEGRMPSQSDERQSQEVWRHTVELLGTAGVTAEEIRNFEARLTQEGPVDEKQNLMEDFVTGLGIFSSPTTIRLFMGQCNTFVPKGQRLEHIISIGRSLREEKE